MITEFHLLLMGASCLLIGFFKGYVFRLHQEDKAKRKVKTPFPECYRGCDPSQCDIWCMPKERFKNNPPND